MSPRKSHFLSFSLLSTLYSAVHGSSAPFSNSSSSSTSSPVSACNSCFILAFEEFYSYPHSVEVNTVTATNMIIPMVTLHPDGSRETNYMTQTQQADASAPSSGITQPAADPFASLTWIVQGMTLTYPTTYVEFLQLQGGTSYLTQVDLQQTCTNDLSALDLPTDSITGLLVPIPPGTTVNSENPTAISAPPAIITYLNQIPAVSDQFGGTDVADCSWSKTVAVASSPEETSPLATVQKVSVSILTSVTADPVLVTAPAANSRTISDAIVHVENSATALDVPANTNTPQTNAQQNTPQNNAQQNTPQAQQQGAQTGGGNSQNTPGVGGAIAGVLNPSGSSNANAGGSNSNQASGGNGNGGSGGSQQSSNSGGSNGNQGSGGEGNGGNGGSPSAGTAPGGQSDQTNGGGNGSGPLPSPLVLIVGGTQTTVAPSVIANPAGTGSVTAFVLGPGSTLVVEGQSVVPVSATGASSPSTSGNVGNAIASGLGYTDSLSTGLADSIHGPNMPLWVMGAAAGVVGALAVGL
ncbi:uncharacterized protein PV09_03465 [Verruconis gallopava]|uniref:Uncharacterized protein n=1 Tax=Verruconis gallopava TaxID=253628 RepID=A0A0D2AF55_9PEZI|nr:uncharacterized protein PV09_03465 [Verruconis gallopava]KIW05593.1 hypothetical protein PV09_03465 [Verruconis gallopava]